MRLPILVLHICGGVIGVLAGAAGVVDATIPDSDTARKFSWMVQEFLNDGPRFQRIPREVIQPLA